MEGKDTATLESFFTHKAQTPGLEFYKMMQSGESRKKKFQKIELLSHAGGR